MRDIVIIPTYNERDNIVLLLEQLTSLYPDMHIVVVDDHSPDGTGDAVSALRHPQVTLKRRSGKLGLASAYTETIAELLSQYADLRSIITMDADHSHDPVVIAAFRSLIDTHDVIIGSRYVAGGGLKDWPLKRQLLSHAGNWYARITSGTGIRDLTAGYQCIAASVLRNPAFQQMSASGFAFQMEMKIIAYMLGARITEVPIIFANRTRGQSKLLGQLGSFIYEGLVMPWQLRLRHRNLRKGVHK
jgi:dolichol-phosphate mannosyltransferase